MYVVSQVLYNDYSFNYSIEKSLRSERTFSDSGSELLQVCVGGHRTSAGSIQPVTSSRMQSLSQRLPTLIYRLRVVVDPLAGSCHVGGAIALTVSTAVCGLGLGWPLGE